MTDQSTTTLSNTPVWTTATGLDDFASLCCREPHIDLLTDPEMFSLTQRMGRFGPVGVAEVAVGSDVQIDCGEHCSAYRVKVLRSGRIESVHRGSSLTADAGMAALFQPEGHAAGRWEAGSRLLAVKIDRCVVEDALSDELGRQLTSQIDFTPEMSIAAGPARSWITMLSFFAEELFRPDSVLNNPVVGYPFVDSLVHGLLLAGDHSHRSVLAEQSPQVAPRTVQAAVQIIEEEAHLPLTVSSIARRSHASVRSLQHGFRRHLGTSPMAYLREVRLRRAHQNLLESDPSSASVASVAYRWGFTNLGRFAAAHTARYDEAPAATLRRIAIQRNGRQFRSATA